MERDPRDQRERGVVVAPDDSGYPYLAVMRIIGDGMFDSGME